jgi:hypothetical protein
MLAGEAMRAERHDKPTATKSSLLSQAPQRIAFEPKETKPTRSMAMDSPVSLQRRTVRLGGSEPMRVVVSSTGGGVPPKRSMIRRLFDADENVQPQRVFHQPLNEEGTL